VGGGHLRAAEAVELAIKEIAPDVIVKNVDVLAYSNSFFRMLYRTGYFLLVNRAPALFGALYDYMDRPRKHAPSFGDQTRILFERINMRRFIKLLHEEAWDVIIHTHYLSAEITAALRRSGKFTVPHCIITTDFDTHRIWMAEPCEYYFTENEEGALHLRCFGVSGERIKATGVPIHPVFSKPLDRAACMAFQEIAGDRPVVLQLAGGFGLGPVEAMFNALLSIETPIELVVVAGRNEKAKRSLEAVKPPHRHKVKVIGFTSRIHELMAAADIVVSKPGGLTVSEVLACGAALAVVNPIPGQESRNSDFLLENGAAVKINNVATAAHKLEALIRDRTRLENIRRNAKRLGRPMAAFEVARLAIDLAAACGDCQRNAL